MKLGEIVYNYRKACKITMQEFANASGLSKGYISMLEKGKVPGSVRDLVPSFETIQKCARGMGMSSEKLMNFLEGDSDYVGTVDKKTGNFLFIFNQSREEELIEAFRKLDEESQNVVLNMVKGLAAKGESK